jgi:O-acetyl-ADP-ribose deacetylase (regulator of RNase III)
MTKILLVKNDVTNLKVEVIVNSANESLLSGSGLCGLIHKKAGADLEKECLKKSPCKTGNSIITKSYNLPFKYIIHTVGPKYYLFTGKEKELLKNCYKSILDLVVKYKIKSIAIPSISTGIYKYPIEEASDIAISTVKEFLNNNKNIDLEELMFCVYSDNDFNIYKSLLEVN